MVWIFSKSFFSSFCFFGSKSPWLCNISDAHANSCSHISSNLLLIHCTWTYLLLIGHPYNACNHTSFLYATHTIYTAVPVILFLVSNFFLACNPCNFQDIFTTEHLHPIYFRYQMHFLLFLFPVSNFCSCIDTSKRPSSQYQIHSQYKNFIHKNLRCLLILHNKKILLSLLHNNCYIE